MCTVSWAHQAGGYHLLANRDEKRTRGVGMAPTVCVSGGVRYIAPMDGDKGGTWIAVNEFGLSVCLLNGHGGSPGPRSRGLLLREIAWAPDLGECLTWLKQMDLRRFAGFTLVVLEPGQPAAIADWNGGKLTIDPEGDARMPLTSSSYDPAGVRRVRQEDFVRRVGARERIDPAALYWFHASHGAGPDAYSPCMHREDAETVSFSWAIVSPGEIRFLYVPAPLCQSRAGEQCILERAA